MEKASYNEDEPEINYSIKKDLSELSPEIVQNAYIEIVHKDKEEVISNVTYTLDPEIPEVAKAILDLEEAGLEVHYYPDGDPAENLPDITNNTPIILGGAIMEKCVHLRAEAYKAAGFTNVFVIVSISVVDIYSKRKKGNVN